VERPEGAGRAGEINNMNAISARTAEHATDQTTEQEWRQLAAQWHSMADQAATMSAGSSQADFFG
jgi:hypothetical protein